MGQPPFRCGRQVRLSACPSGVSWIAKLLGKFGCIKFLQAYACETLQVRAATLSLDSHQIAQSSQLLKHGTT